MDKNIVGQLYEIGRLARSFQHNHDKKEYGYADADLEEVIALVIDLRPHWDAIAEAVRDQSNLTWRLTND